MRCYLCNKSVVGADAITVPRHGPAHNSCYEAKLAMVRNFKGLKICELSDGELANLKDLVLAEENDRRGDNDDDIELF